MGAKNRWGSEASDRQQESSHQRPCLYNAEWSSFSRSEGRTTGPHHRGYSRMSRAPHSYEGVTGRCWCTGVAHLGVISWASYGVETQREASACFLTWCGQPSTEGSCGIFLVSCFTCVMIRGVWKLQPRRTTPEPPLCFQLQTQLLKSRLNLTINLPVHPPTLSLQPLWSFSEEKETHGKEHSNSPHKTVHTLSASSHRGKGLIPPGLTKTST
ncbi:hypothetical protein CRENBAI_004374 [Crenichthys baileyi]|uniref:Uncharacterized protein n=1 Tax=Crenichthys baileyi TaxID=28760 RepID=A0AAV9RSY9_9TELE